MSRLMHDLYLTAKGLNKSGVVSDKTLRELEKAIEKDKRENKESLTRANTNSDDKL